MGWMQAPCLNGTMRLPFLLVFTRILMAVSYFYHGFFHFILGCNPTLHLTPVMALATV
jgi:hypothetical protein